jgi:uncharacterized membrane protein YphA (DoxX/SURF4 family)
MSLSRRVADPLLAATFMACGLEALRTPPTGGPMAVRVDPDDGEIRRGQADPDRSIRVTGAVQMAAGALLASRRCTRLAALALLATAVPATPGGRRFWMDSDYGVRPAGRPVVVRNIGLIGGLLLAALDTGGAPSLSWRARHRGERLELAPPGHRADAATAPRP